MKTKAFLARYVIGILVVMLALPAEVFPQAAGTRPAFSREELDQMVAPVALYPDSLLAQVLVAATYPEQVMEADQWVKQNGGLQGDQLNAALDTMNWDLSVKALVPFPKVLDMMSAKQEWTQKLGEAFLAQESDVMDSVQRLRSMARAQGNLKTTQHQKVVVRGENVEILPADPQIVYVPAYNPAVVYGPWGYPAYPPFAYSPYYPAYVYDPAYVVPGFVAAGALGFVAGVAVGSFWNVGWGHWDWGRRDVVVNVNRTVNINRTDIRNTTVRTTNFNTAVRQGKIGSSTVRRTVGQPPAKRPTPASVQQGLQKRGTATRAPGAVGAKPGTSAGVKKGTAQRKEVRGQRPPQRTGQAVSRGGKASSRQAPKTVRSGSTRPSGATRGSSVRKAPAPRAGGGGNVRKAPAPRAAGGGAKSAPQKRERK